jgi:hypothetical protein
VHCRRLLPSVDKPRAPTGRSTPSGYPIEERRAASPFPPGQLLTATNGDFAAQLNKWFDDRVGFRDPFIRAKNQIDYTLFHASKKVYVGANGWLFYRNQYESIANVDAAKLSVLEASISRWRVD